MRGLDVVGDSSFLMQDTDVVAYVTCLCTWLA